MTTPRDVQPGAFPLRRLARAASLLSLAFISLFVLGEILTPHAPPPAGLHDLVGLALFPGGLVVGLLLAWRWELWGGLVSLGSMLAFYTWLGLQDGSLPRGWVLPLLTLPGLLFVTCGLRTRCNRQA